MLGGKEGVILGPKAIHVPSYPQTLSSTYHIGPHLTHPNQVRGVAYAHGFLGVQNRGSLFEMRNSDANGCQRS